MRTSGILSAAFAGIALTTLGATATAAPMTYEIDSNHTFPSFAADHMGGLSLWRGKINSTSGTIVLDVEAGTGSVDITMDMTSIDFGHDGLSDHARSADMFDVEVYPTATYSGDLVDFEDGSPTAVDGTLTMHGVSQPVRLTINTFLCRPHPQRGVEVCGADASATINRADFGVDYAQNFGFLMDVALNIQVEALAAE